MKKFISITLLICIIGILLYRGNATVGTTYYEITADRLPASFDSYKIVQLSDLHDAKFGDQHEDVVSEVRAIAPDVIFITGDFIDSNRYKLDQSLALVKRIQGVAPIYYVTGNHEVSTNDTDRIKEKLKELNVRVLSDEAYQVTSKAGETIVIGGIEDPLMSMMEDDKAVQVSVARAFEDTMEETFKILLSHRPEQFHVYVASKIDLTFSGHAHGGQFRFPGVGGLVAPGQGWFPNLTSGVHEQGESKLVISRGLGNSIIPLRILNKPEIVVVTLKK